MRSKTYLNWNIFYVRNYGMYGGINPQNTRAKQLKSVELRMNLIEKRTRITMAASASRLD